MLPENILAKLTASFAAKTQRSTYQIFMLSIIAGAFIALGASFMLLLKSDGGLSFAAMSLLCGMAFSLGLFSIFCAGGELFTGNCLITSVINYPMDKNTIFATLEYMGLVYFGNFVGTILIAILLFFSGFDGLNGGLVGETAAAVAMTKYSLPIGEMFFRAIMCNFIVCLAVFIGVNAETITDKFFAAAIPVTAFVACSFEHCIANMFFFSLGGLTAVSLGMDFSLGLIILNLIVTTFGNIVGGAILFSGMFYLASKKQQ